MQRCILIGGEPTLHPAFTEFVSLIEQEGLNLALVTNGLKFADKKFTQNCLKAGLENLTISLHGWSKKSYLDNTKNDAFECLEIALANIIEAGIKVSFEITLGRTLYNNLKEILDFIKRNSVKWTICNIAAPVLSKNGTIIDKEVLTPEQISESCQEIHKIVKLYGIKVSFLLTVPFCNFPRKFIDELITQRLIRYICQLQYGGGFVISSDNSLCLCTHFADFPITDYQETNELFSSRDKFLTFWNSSQMYELRNKASVARSKGCVDCDYWGICKGGCIAFWSSRDPEDFMSYQKEFASQKNKF
ncbi:MAG: radical SAM domain-containing protein [Parcubacteria group bacterium Athens1014_10]|nr:MAG: radical SAM domain-containing protein [Parcubacteria group bacterium Athens1014_10]TSD04822.1 MAG: radical SAM domain-containing protein [Parcubacteria group bacterium Athens0714_12]